MDNKDTGVRGFGILPVGMDTSSCSGRRIGRWKTLILIMLLASIGGCVSLLVPRNNELYLASHFSELETYMESQIPHISTATSSELLYLCYAYFNLKKYSKLAPCLDQLERNIQKGDHGGLIWSDETLHLYELRAQSEIDVGNYPKAVEFAERERQFAFENDMKTSLKMQALGTLALAYALKGDRGNALKYANELEHMSVGFAGPALMVHKVIGLAKVYMALGEFKKSLEFIKQDDTYKTSRAAIEGIGVAFGAFRAGEAWTFIDLPREFLLNKSLYETHQIADSKVGYDRLLAMPQTADNGGIYWLVLFDRAKISEGEGNSGQAIEFYRRAVEVIERQRSTINTEASRIGFVGDKQQVYHRLIAALMADGKATQALEYAERAKARALVDLLASKQDLAAANVTDLHVTALLTDWQQTEEGLHIEVTSSPSTHRNARGVQIKLQLETVSPELASIVMVNETKSSTIQALLAPDETLLEYYYQGSDLFAFLVTRDFLYGAKLNGSGLQKDVEAFRESLEDPKSNRVQELSANLYARLIKPVDSKIKTARLLIVGHGVLHYLPFGALSETTGYLVEKHSLRLLPSASVMQFLKDRKSHAGGALLALGNPDLGDRGYDLKFAQDEVSAIAAIYPLSKILTGKEATKGAFQTLGPQFSYLHLATHGKFDAEFPLKSGLLLAGSSQGEGFLSVGDLYSMRLNADLVTLSACETGLGKVNNGDDVVGLTRGFLYAGSNSIIASLWEVDDLATSQLMAEFYRNLNKGTDKQEALRQAQLDTKRHFSHPYYWAAFQLTGMP